MQRTCVQCQETFEVTDSDLTFYDQISPVFAGRKYSIPPPSLCPQCRQQQRYIWRPELHVFPRKSDLSGKQILSMFSPDVPCVVYSPEEWWSDEWNPLDYGREVDFSRPFFEQLQELIQTVPLPATSVYANENCDYVNSASWNKNCYLLAGANHNEDCYYGNFVNYCRDCVDCSFVDHCELCYECVDCAACYRLRSSQNCSNCHDSAFLFGCRGCRNCFGSVNLADREYVYMNEQLSKQEYWQRIAKWQLGRRSCVEEAKTFFEAHRLTFPHKEMLGEMNEDVTGNGILRSRRAHECFDVSDLEDCKYCSWFHQSKSCMDCYAWGFTAEESYSCMEVGARSSRALFSIVTYSGANVLYSYVSQHASHIFGCVSMRRNSYCILNKQYTKEEYERLAPRVIEHMQKTGEWGQFFPYSVCPLSYNQTIAQDYFPLERQRAEKLGAKWHDEPAPTPQGERYTVPDSIRDVPEDIASEVLTCRVTGRPYKLIPQELRFYREQGIPVPDTSFFARHEARLRKRNPRRLWDRACAKCGRAIRTSFSPERPEIVYCESCYLASVY